MMREVMKSGVGIFILLLVGLGCGVTKPSWLTWEDDPAPTNLPENTESPSEKPSTPPTPVLPAKTPTLTEHKQPEVEAITQYNLALQLEANGKLPEAVTLYQKAADQANAEAQFRLGLCYAKGEGVPKDRKEAFDLYKVAAGASIFE